MIAATAYSIGMAVLPFASASGQATTVDTSLPDDRATVPETSLEAGKVSESAPDEVYGPPAPQNSSLKAAQNSLWGMRELILLAEADHPDVLAAKAVARSYAANVSVARSEYLPTPQATLDLSPGLQSSKVGLGMPIFSGGRLDANLRRSKALSRGADAGINAARQQIGFNTIDAYTQWAIATRSVKVKLYELARLDERLELIQRRIAAGASGRNDEQLVTSRIKQAQGDLAAQHANVVAALSLLSQLIGRDVRDDQLEREASLPVLPPCDQMLERGLASSSAVKKVEAQIEAASQAKKSAKASLFPTVTANVDYSRQHYQSAADPRNYSDVRGYIGLSVAPGAGLGAPARIRAAQADIEAATESLASVQRNLTAKIQGQCASLVAAKALVEQLVGARAATEQVYESYMRLFIAGKRSWLDVMNAAREVTAVDLTLVQSQERARAISWSLLLLSEGDIESMGVEP